MTNLLLLVLFIVVILAVSSKHINSKYSIDSLLHFYENVDTPSFLEPEGSSIVINHFDDLDAIKKQLETQSLDSLIEQKKLNLKNKPNLFIFNPHDINARNWLSWGSRNSNYINEPYVLLCILSIIRHCGKDFNVVLLNDQSFEKLIPNWSIDMKHVSGNLKCQLRNLGMYKILYNYGGLFVPRSFLCKKSLLPLFHSKQPHQILCGSLKNMSIMPVDICISNKFIGCEKENPNMKHFINEVSILQSQDYTNEMEFLGKVEKILYQLVLDKNAHQIQPIQLGLVDNECQYISTKDLLSECKIQLHKDCVGILIDEKMLLSYFNYGWFVRMSPEQIFTSKLWISHQFFKALQ